MIDQITTILANGVQFAFVIGLFLYIWKDKLSRDQEQKSAIHAKMLALEAQIEKERTASEESRAKLAVFDEKMKNIGNELESLLLSQRNLQTEVKNMRLELASSIKDFSNSLALINQTMSQRDAQQKDYIAESHNKILKAINEKLS